VDGNKDGELFYMATWLLLSVRLYVITDEIAVSHLLPKYIVLKSKNDLIPLTRLSPFVIEKRAVLEELKK